MRPLFRVSSNESGVIKKIEFLHKDGQVEDVTESIHATGFSVSGGDTLMVTVRTDAITGETIKEAK